jgi:hypothetical protein
MNEVEKEQTIKTLKQFFRNNYRPDVAEEMCNRLDVAKKEADTLEQIFNLYQRQCQEFCRAYMNLVFSSREKCF